MTGSMDELAAAIALCGSAPAPALTTGSSAVRQGATTFAPWTGCIADAATQCLAKEVGMASTTSTGRLSREPASGVRPA